MDAMACISLGVAQTAGTRSAMRRDAALFDIPDQRPGVFSLEHKLVVGLVGKRNDYCRISGMNIPEDALAVLIERPRGEDAGNVGAGKFNPVPPAVDDFLVHPNARYVLERDGEFAF